MATRGAKPKSTRAKELAGSRRPVNSNEPQPEVSLPDCPDHLPEMAQQEWDRVAPQLFDSGIMTALERAALTGYCESWAMYVEASVELQDNGAIARGQNGQPYQSPYVNVMSMALKQLKDWMVELGMTPSSRSRVTSVKPPEPGGKARFFKIVG